MLPTSTKLNVNLNTNNTIFRDKGHSFNAVLKDNNGLPMSGKTIIFKINGISYSKTTDENGIAKQNINLNPGQYSISTTYSDSTYYNSITKVKPGITGYWQVNGRNDVDFEERAYMDTYYIERRGIVMDLKIILKTFLKIFKKEGAV